ncbi:uncharacterized protein MKK02DRAFT_39675 [Dioszegia hungarica]|uniref:Uncharacterized protein n=1 Tax=Dioszegia hungarica TaxID=4972 RepID=A0AA38LX73_9TREE|nr:uncharacterized protein MKK02DRAFT_39675 [Dioszegia hungarica]KAI9639375.1 hypothetical protein MKK02DRAFT_39675 [Dioszegia hungarica]
MSRAPSRTQIKPTPGHKRKASFFTSGPHTKNPGSLDRNDDKRCKFFVWADELDKNQTPTTPSRPTPSRPPPSRPTPSRAPLSQPLPEIDWDQVDTDDLERQAIASTPGSSQPSQSNSGTPFQNRLQAMAEDTRKRKREDEETPRRERQDRLLSAAEKAKEGFRKTINQLQATIKERDATIEELKGMLRDLGGDV